jgi:hypothetical protein
MGWGCVSSTRVKQKSCCSIDGTARIPLSTPKVIGCPRRVLLLHHNTYQVRVLPSHKLDQERLFWIIRRCGFKQEPILIARRGRERAHSGEELRVEKRVCQAGMLACPAPCLPDVINTGQSCSGLGLHN